jgi:hypothetical protein
MSLPRKHPPYKIRGSKVLVALSEVAQLLEPACVNFSDAAG